MRTKLLLLLILTASTLVSCSKDDETDIIWRDNNETAFLKTASLSEYQTIQSQSKNGLIAYKVIKSGEGKTPLYTDQVKVLYTGWYKEFDWNKGDTFINEDGTEIKNKYIFDSTANNSRTFSVNGLIDGFTTALQYMKEGDKWEVWIPSKLGYGQYQQNNIPENTTLVFEIELVKVL